MNDGQKLTNFGDTTTFRINSAGSYDVAALASNWHGGSLTLQITGPDNATFLTVKNRVATSVAFTANGTLICQLPQGTYRWLVNFAADPTSAVATAAADAATAAADPTISGNPTALALVNTIIAQITAMSTAVAAFKPATAAVALAAAIAAEAAAEANGTISGNPTALGKVQQVGTDLAAIDLSAPTAIYASLA